MWKQGAMQGPAVPTDRGVVCNGHDTGDGDQLQHGAD